MNGSTDERDGSHGRYSRVPTGYMHLGTPDRTITRTVDYGEGVLADYDEIGQIIGIESIGRLDLLEAAWRVLTERNDENT